MTAVAIVPFTARERARVQAQLRDGSGRRSVVAPAGLPGAEAPNRTVDLEYQTLVTAAAKVDGGLISASASGRRIYVRKGTARGRIRKVEGRDIFVGAAAFLELGIVTLDASANLSLPFVAAQATIGAATVNYRLQVFGYRGDTSAFVRKGVFDVESYAGTLANLADATKRVISDTANYDPEPIGGIVLVPEQVEEIGIVVEGLAMAYAARQIAEGLSLDETLQAPQSHYLSAEESASVRMVYRALGVAEGRRPTQTQRGRARALLTER